MIAARFRRPPSPGCFPGQKRLVEDFLKIRANAARALDIGAGGSKIAPSFLAVDIQPVARVDVIADAHRLPFADESVGAVNCNALLEHVREPFQVMAEIHRVLEPGGRTAVWVPFMAAYHRSPEDYFRYTVSGARALMGDFAEVQVYVGPGAFSTLSEVLRNCAAMLCGFGNDFLFKVFCVVFGYLFYPVKLLDGLFLPSERVSLVRHSTAAGFLLLGIK